MSQFEHETWSARSESRTYGEESSSSSRDKGPGRSRPEPLIVHSTAELGVTVGSLVRGRPGSAHSCSLDLVETSLLWCPELLIPLCPGVH